MKSALIDKVKQKMEETHTGATALEELTGIPKHRIYKWLDETGKPSSPKKEDAAILQKWVNGEKFQKVPRETLDQIIRKEITFLKASVKVMTLKLINLESAATKKPFDEVFLDVQKKTEQEIKRLADEGD